MFKNESALSRMMVVILVSAILSAGTSIFPAAATADTVAVQTQQLLPATGGSCIPLSVYGFTPYIYDNSLHSFDFTVTDESYVAISGLVESTSLSFQLMTRWKDASGALRIHVDVPTTPVTDGLSLSVTLLSAKGVGQPICISVATMSISATGQGIVPAPGTPIGTPVPPSSSGGGAAAPVVKTPTQGQTPGGAGGGSTSTPSVSPTTTSATGSSPSALASIQDRLVEQCAAGGAFRLWIVLLAVYALIMITAVFGQLPAPQTYSRGQRMATIIVPFALLLGFWYVVESCRATVWAPGVALLIALLGLLGVHRNDARIATYISRLSSSAGSASEKKETAAPPKKETVMITPPPSDKTKESSQ